MKKTIMTILAVAMTALFGGNAAAQQYALHYSDSTTARLAEGDTITHLLQDWEAEMHVAYISFYVENLTDDTLATNQIVTAIDMPSGMNFVVCAAGQCREDQQLLPDYKIAPKSIHNEVVTIEPHFEGLEVGEAIFKLEVGNAGTMDNKVTVYIKLDISKRASISDVHQNPIKVYPNPTRGRVTVGDSEYDLSTRPAGVYVLPYEGSAVRVIKL